MKNNELFRKTLDMWHVKVGLMWLDLPGFPPTLTVGSIVPLNETS